MLHRGLYVGIDKGLQQFRQRREVSARKNSVGKRLDPASSFVRGTHQRNARMRAANIGRKKRHRRYPRHPVGMVNPHVLRSPRSSTVISV